MISTEETTGAPAPETHDASRTPLPASTRVYVQGELFPQIRVPMREIALSDTKSFNGRIEKNDPVRVYDCSGPWGDPGFHRHLRGRPARPPPRLDPRPRRRRSLRRPRSPAAGQRLPHREARRVRHARPSAQQVRRVPRPHRRRAAAARAPAPAQPVTQLRYAAPGHHHARDGIHRHPRKHAPRRRSRIDRSKRRHRPQRSRQAARRLRPGIRPDSPTTPPASSAASPSASPPRSPPSSSAAKSPPAAPSSRSTSITPSPSR